MSRRSSEVWGSVLGEPDLDTTPLIHALTDAIAHRPGHAPALAALIRELTSG